MIILIIDYSAHLSINSFINVRVLNVINLNIFCEKWPLC